MNGLKTYQALFHTTEGKNFEKYNNWNFTTTANWDGNEDANFWYSPSTTMLYITMPYEIGKQSV